MKILHTADWHLGQKFVGREREEEHRLALDWLARVVAEEHIELLVVAGDVFDIGNPPNYARALYYGFFKKLRHTACRHVVITGGNHDSPQMLEAPKELLHLFDIHVIGAVQEDPAAQVLVLKNEAGEPETVVAAVPFLRDQDLRRAISGETGQERIERIKAGILAHYDSAGQAAEALPDAATVPVIAMGHLYTSGAETSEKQENIYLGNLENIRADQFSTAFDYVALGHVHRPQALGGLAHVRYSGSLLPLSFSETKDEKMVVVVEFDGKKIGSIREVPVPIFRRLKTIEGSFEEVKERLLALDEKYRDGLPAWVEVIVESESLIPNLNGLLLDFTKDLHLELLRTRLSRSLFSSESPLPEAELSDLEPLDVFKKKCESGGKPPEQMEELIETFRELQEWIGQR